MKLSVILSLLVLTLSSVSLTAQGLTLNSGIQKNQLIELYTSEGCSSCPSADKWLSRLKTNPELWKQIIPVAFHVDYWDQLGWKDKLARADFSQRQRRYHSEGGIGQVYTPGFVINGMEWRGFFKGEKPLRLEKIDIGEITAQVDSEKIKAEFLPLTAIHRDLLFHVAVLGFDISTEVQAGENRGKILSHDFAVVGYDRNKVVGNNNHFYIEMVVPETIMAVKEKAIIIWVSEVDKQFPLQITGGWL